MKTCSCAPSIYKSCLVFLELPTFFKRKSRGSSSSSTKETNDTKRLKENTESDNLADTDSSLSEREEDEALTASNSQTMPSNNDKVDEILLKLKQLDIIGSQIKSLQESVDLEKALNEENARSIEFQRVHRIGKKYVDANKPRAIIARCLRFKDRETLFALRRSIDSDSGYGVGPDLPKQIIKMRKKLIPRMVEARAQGKRAAFSKAEPYKLFMDGVEIK